MLACDRHRDGRTDTEGHTTTTCRASTAARGKSAIKMQN